ncbi:MAG: hypothetical protein R2699_16395 [Acidimicrobiales bacterium]
MYAGAVEEDLAEHLFAGDVADGSHVDAVRFHVDDERRDAVVLAALGDGGRVGADEEQAPPGQVRRRDPDLGSVEDVVVAVGDGEGAQVGEVRAGLGFGEALAPVVVGVEDVGDPPVALLVGAPADDHRTDLPQAVGVVDARRARPCHLLGVDHRLGRRGVAPAPLGRPGDGRPATLVELALPGAPAFHLRQHARGAGAGRVVLAGVSPRLEERRQLGVEPGHQLVAERLVLRRVGEVHGGRAYPRPTMNMTLMSGSRSAS